MRGASEWIRGVAQKEKKREGRSRQRQESTHSTELRTMGDGIEKLEW